MSKKSSTNIETKELVKALNSLFEEKGGWEIPDEAISGIAIDRIRRLEVQVLALEKRLANYIVAPL